VAYRDSFRLLLQFLKKKTGKQPFMLSVDDLDAPAIIDFLESLEEQRGNQVCSRNARLTAIRSFFHVVALRDPGSIGVVGRVLAKGRLANIPAIGARWAHAPLRSAGVRPISLHAQESGRSQLRGAVKIW
jgi:site-specific recombinase XerD